MKIREINKADAENFALLPQHIDNHSASMLWEAEERKASAAQAGQMIKSFKEKEILRFSFQKKTKCSRGTCLRQEEML